MKSISIFGTTSDSGKSTVTASLMKVFNDMGYKVAPFKAQNMSNNSSVCDDGSEVGRAQYFQAEVIGMKTSYHINPILLKPQGEGVSQLVLNGKVERSIHARTYYREIDQLKPYVNNSFEYLLNGRDFVISEGAGSPVELNLIDRDLSNTYTAREFNNKIILVADIERGGVFASIYGTYNLLSKDLRDQVIGVIINKFRGDISLFNDGIRIIEKDFGLPVIGVLPYINLNIDMEDSLSIRNYQQSRGDLKISVGVIKLPHISNYNDIDPLMSDGEIDLTLIENYEKLDKYDLVIIPGSKTTIQDLVWLKNIGLYDEIKNKAKNIFGICGGYQMLFERMIDAYGVENSNPSKEKGFGIIDDDILYLKEKTVGRDTYKAFGMDVKGYQIHNGYSNKYPLFYDSNRVKGTHIHGIFENDNFRNAYFRSIDNNYLGYDSYKALKHSKVSSFVGHVRDHLDVGYILESIL